MWPLGLVLENSTLLLLLLYTGTYSQALLEKYVITNSEIVAQMNRVALGSCSRQFYPDLTFLLLYTCTQALLEKV